MSELYPQVITNGTSALAGLIPTVVKNFPNMFTSLGQLVPQDTVTNTVDGLRNFFMSLGQVMPQGPSGQSTTEVPVNAGPSIMNAWAQQPQQFTPQMLQVKQSPSPVTTTKQMPQVPQMDFAGLLTQLQQQAQETQRNQGVSPMQLRSEATDRQFFAQQPSVEQRYAAMAANPSPMPAHYYEQNRDIYSGVQQPQQPQRLANGQLPPDAIRARGGDPNAQPGVGFSPAALRDAQQRDPRLFSPAFMSAFMR